MTWNSNQTMEWQNLGPNGQLRGIFVIKRVTHFGYPLPVGANFHGTVIKDGSQIPFLASLESPSRLVLKVLDVRGKQVAFQLEKR